MPEGSEDFQQGDVPSYFVWNELRYIRRKVDSLEQKVLYMFGTFTAITVAIAVVEFIGKTK